MLLKMIVGLSGPLFNLAPGDEYEFEENEAKRLIDADFAVEVAAPDAPAPAIKKKGKANVVSREGNDPTE